MRHHDMNRHTDTVKQPSGHRPEGFAIAEHRLGHARVLGRYRRHCFPVPTSLSQVCHQTAESIILIFRIGHYRSCAKDQQYALVAVSGLGDAPQSRFVTRSLMAWHQSSLTLNHLCMLRHEIIVLAEQPTDAVDGSHSLLDDAQAQTVDAKASLRVLTLDRHVMHRRALDRFADRLRIGR
jgi:hypothetical protein